jgi:hypothetical protein
LLDLLRRLPGWSPWRRRRMRAARALLADAPLKEASA